MGVLQGSCYYILLVVVDVYTYDCHITGSFCCCTHKKQVASVDPTPLSISFGWLWATVLATAFSNLNSMKRMISGDVW